MPKKVFQKIAKQFRSGDAEKLSTKLQRCFKAEKSLKILTPCSSSQPKLVSILFLGPPLQVKGIEGATPPGLTSGAVPPSNTPHWKAGEEGCYPGVYSMAASTMKAEIKVDGGGLTLSDYNLLGVSQETGIVFNQSELKSQTYTCQLNRHDRGAAFTVWTVEWALQKKDTLEYILLGTSDINLIFLWSAPCGRWKDKAVWYECLWLALGRLGANGQDEPSLCLGAMVDGLVRSENLEYDTLLGAPGCGWTPLADDPQPFDLAKFIQVEYGLFKKVTYYEISPGVKVMRMPIKVSCYDLSAGLCLAGCSVGLSVVTVIMGNLNPKSSTVTMTIRDDLRTVGFLKSSSKIGGFATHVCTVYADRIYDALMASVETDKDEGLLVHPLFALSLEDYLKATVADSSQHSSLPDTIRKVKLPFNI